MNLLLSVFHVLIPVIYLVVFAGYLWQFWTDHPTAHRLCTCVAVVVMFVHTACMIIKSVALGRLPMGSPLEFMSALALAILATYLIIEKRTSAKNTGFLVTGTAFLLVLLANFFGAPAPKASPFLQDPGFASHAILVLLAYTALSLSFLYAVLYLILARQLMQRQFGLLFRRLPSLDTLERMSVGGAELGVPLLFLALSLGHLWLYDLADRVDPEMATQLSPYDPKILITWVIFLVYMVGLAGHRLLGWRGRRMSVLAVAGYLILVAATGIVHHFFPSFHNFKSTKSGVERTVREDSVFPADHLAAQWEGRR